mmetsp:Transcript_19184/g.29574  ORF Transcript_19184/g.29574 Transcript_19184/m.29574 type:complete len:92 (-) Transcript_19184:312-587(-)
MISSTATANHVACDMNIIGNRSMQYDMADILATNNRLEVWSTIAPSKGSSAELARPTITLYNAKNEDGRMPYCVTPVHSTSSGRHPALILA